MLLVNVVAVNVRNVFLHQIWNAHYLLGTTDIKQLQVVQLVAPTALYSTLYSGGIGIAGRSVCVSA